MNTLQKACILSCDNWVASFPSEIPKHNFSNSHNEKMQEIFQPKSSENKRRPSKKIIKLLIIAAILFAVAVATTVFAIPTTREYVVEKFSDHSTYLVIDHDGEKKVKSLTVNYVPEGFEKVSEDISTGFYIEDYSNSDQYFSAQKCMLGGTVSYDTEFYDSEIVDINGADGIYHKSNNGYSGIIYNNGEYLFMIDSRNMDKEELVKIAQNLE